MGGVDRDPRGVATRTFDEVPSDRDRVGGVRDTDTEHPGWDGHAVALHERPRAAQVEEGLRAGRGLRQPVAFDDSVGRGDEGRDWPPVDDDVAGECHARSGEVEHFGTAARVRGGVAEVLGDDPL